MNTESTTFLKKHAQRENLALDTSDNVDDDDDREVPDNLAVSIAQDVACLRFPATSRRASGRTLLG